MHLSIKTLFICIYFLAFCINVIVKGQGSARDPKSVASRSSSVPYRRDPGWRPDAEHRKRPHKSNNPSHRRPDNRRPRGTERRPPAAPIPMAPVAVQTAAQAAVQAAALMPPPPTPPIEMTGGSHSLQWVPDPPAPVTIDLTASAVPAVPAPPPVASVVVPTFTALNQRSGEKRSSSKKPRRPRV